MKKNMIGALLGASAAMISGAAAEEPATLADIAFLEGAWRGGEEYIFEEIWSGPAGGVMTGMARGYEGEALSVLEYIIVAETADRLEMRFKHFNADYSTWENNGPVTLMLTSAQEDDVTFSADPPSEKVKSIRYWKPSAQELRADIVVAEDGAEEKLSIFFEKRQ